MKKAALPFLIGLIALTGCAHHYVMKLTNGAQITTASKPRLKDGIYHFKDAKGEEHVVAAASVRECAPASMAAREDKPRPMKMESEKKRKWYLLWLA
ncbi:MAG: YgdI/YgdR family lipoprotein [Verrucomicrobiota bacterium]|jgi:hypothetical protein